MNILVLDVGTSSMRGTVLDDAAEKRWRGQIRYSPSYQENGWAEQSPEDWSGALRELCAGAVSACRIDAVALTAQRSSLIPLRGDGTVLRDAIMWQDTRNQDICERLRPWNDRIRELAGAGLNTVFSGGKMAWLREYEPEVYKSAAKLVVIPDYLIREMTGQFVTDHTYASRSLLMDIRTRQWSPELTDLFGLDEEKLCRLIPPSSVAGTICGEFTRSTGLPEGVPVITCGGDQQCAALGQGITGAGSAVINLGTGAYLLAGIPSVPERLPEGLICNAAAIPEQYILEASVLTCGSAVDWFLPDGDYAMVGQALRESPPGARGVCALPYFQGRSAPDWNSQARGAFCGLSLETGRLDMLRALLESIVIEVGRSLRSMEELEPVALLSVSGGLSHTPEMRQLLADVTGKTVLYFEDDEATTRGAWMSAGHRLGLTARWAEAWTQARPAECLEYVPAPEKTALYARKVEQLEALYRSIRNL